MSTVTLPYIHLNGSGKDSLMDEAREMYSAAGACMRVFQKSGPNGRDYYPLGGDALGEAVRQHRARIEALQNIQDEMLVLFQGIEAGGAALP